MPCMKDHNVFITYQTNISCGTFVEHFHEIFPEYSEKVPYEIPVNIPK